MSTINEVYEELKQKRDNIQKDLEIAYGKANDFLKGYDFKSGVDEIMKNSRLVGEVSAYTDVIVLIEESGVLEEDLAEKDKEIGKLTRRLNLTTAYKDNQKERANKYYNELKQVRKQVCDEIRKLAHNYMEMPICENCGEGFCDSMITSCDLNEIIDQIEKGEEK